MASKVDLTWKDSILVSLYDDLALMDLSNIITFHNKTSCLLSLLERVFKSPSKPRTIQFLEDEIDFTDVIDVRGAAHADITNMRFLLQGQPKDIANAQLRDLKTHARSCVEKSPKKLILRLNRMERPILPSPWPLPELDINASPTPGIELEPLGGNGLDLNSRLTSFKRKLETQKLGPADESTPESNSDSGSDGGKQYLVQTQINSGGADTASPFFGFPDLVFGETTPFSASPTPKGKVKKLKDKKVKDKKHKNIFASQKSAAANIFSTVNASNQNSHFNNPSVSSNSTNEKLLRSISPSKRSLRFKLVPSGKKRKPHEFEGQIAPLKRARKQRGSSYDDASDMALN